MATSSNKLDTALKELNKEQKQWNAKLANLKREKLSLEAKNADLSVKNGELADQKTQLQGTVDGIQMQIVNLKEDYSALLQDEANLKTRRDAVVTDIVEKTVELEAKKASLDADLAEYELIRKQEVKASILRESATLEQTRQQLATTKQELHATQDRLSDVNQAAIAEESEFKTLQTGNAEQLGYGRQELAALNVEIQKKKDDLQQLLFDLNTATVAMKKAKADHDKFIQYEEQARKILSTKDRELQERASELATENQFLSARRSFLPEM